MRNAIKMYQVSLLYITTLTAYVASLTAQQQEQFLSIANLLTSVKEISKTYRMSLSHCLLGLPLSLFPRIFPFKMIFPKPLPLSKWPKYFSSRFDVKISNHWSSTLSSSLIDLFVLCSIHDILKIFLQHFIYPGCQRLF